MSLYPGPRIKRTPNPYAQPQTRKTPQQRAWEQPTTIQAAKIDKVMERVTKPPAANPLGAPLYDLTGTDTSLPVLVPIKEKGPSA